MKQEIEVVFEDNDIAVCVKPAGIPSQPDKGGTPDMVRLLKSRLFTEIKKRGNNTDKEPYVGVIHRLDRNVRGLLVFAKTKRAAAELSRQLRERLIKKKYFCVVTFEEDARGKTDKEFIKLINYLKFDKSKNYSYITEDETDKEAEKAELLYRVIKISGNKALVEIELLTGRHHQIRVQLAKVFNGIAGDAKYNKDYENEKGKPELMLESCTLRFFHPVTGKEMNFEISPQGRGFEEFL